jgi:hypothetical protein
MAAKIRNSFTLYQALIESGSVEIRLHQTVLHNSIYRTDDQNFVNHHAYGILAAHSPGYYLGGHKAGACSTYTLRASTNL